MHGSLFYHTFPIINLLRLVSCDFVSRRDATPSKYIDKFGATPTLHGYVCMYNTYHLAARPEKKKKKKKHLSQ